MRELEVPLKVRWALVAVPILVATLDMIENGCIAVRLWTWPDLSKSVVGVSTLATQVKIMAGALTETLMAGLAVVWSVRLFKSRGYV
jgi:hypothetical protein